MDLHSAATLVQSAMMPSHVARARDGGAVAVTACLTLLVAGCVRLRRRRSAEVHKRGVRLIDAPRPRRRGTSLDSLTVAGVPIALLDETKHFKLIGTTGTGKSTAIRELLGAALERGDRAVFADPDGGYRRRFERPSRGDVVLNPFEDASVQWNPLLEIVRPYDIEQLCGGLIPSGEDASASEWRGYARIFLAAVIRACRERRSTLPGELWRLLAVAPCEELRPLVAGTPAQPFLDADNARMFASLRSVAVAAVAALEHVAAQRGSPFSVRRWVRAGPRSGALFLPYKAGQIAALRAMIATWLRLAIVETMDGAEDHDQRLWLVVDELDALGAIDGLKDALARLRKFGGRCVLGFQSMGQVSATYGPGDAQTIVENCGNTLVLRCSGSDQGGTSHFASRLIGEREIVRRQVSRGSDRDGSFTARGARRSRNVSEQHVTEIAVMPSELEQLADLRGYFKSASRPDWLRVRLERRE